MQRWTHLKVRLPMGYIRKQNLSFLYKQMMIFLFHSVTETLITPESFAEVLSDDLDLPATTFVPAIAQAIQQQVKQHSVEPEISLDDMTDQRVIIKVRTYQHIISVMCSKGCNSKTLRQMVYHSHANFS